jgi:Asp/Glu/hydantoin racemase
MPRLLLINPNTTAAITDLAARHVAATLRRLPGSLWEIEPATASFGAPYIADEASYAIAGHAALDAYTRLRRRFDAVLLACFGDPGLFALREASGLPVFALAEASMREASRIGRYAIVTGGARWKPMLERHARALQLDAQLASIRTVDLTGAQIAADPDAALATLAAACRAAAGDGAQAVILGGAGLAGLAARIAPQLDVPVIDSVEAAARAVGALGVRRASA